MPDSLKCTIVFIQLDLYTRVQYFFFSKPTRKHAQRMYIQGKCKLAVWFLVKKMLLVSLYRLNLPSASTPASATSMIGSEWQLEGGQQLSSTLLHFHNQ